MTEQPTNPQKTETPEPQPAITLGDVLRAVFLPPRDGSTRDSLALPAIPTPWQHPAPSPDLSDLLAPPVVTYADEPPAPEADAAPVRVAVLGLGTLVTLLIAILAQTALAEQGRHTIAAILYGLAGVSWLGLLITEFGVHRGGLLARGPQVTGSPAYPIERARPAWLSRTLIAVAALLLSVATYVLTANNSFTLPGVTTWVLSVALWMVAAAERSPGELLAAWRGWLSDLPQTVRGIRPPRPLPLVGLLAVLGVAAFFRFYRLDAIPVEMTSDHVEKILDAFAVSQGMHSVFFRANGGREALQFYLIPIAASLFGTGMSFLTLKLVTAIEGVLLIPLIIWLGRELVDRETGFLAAALVAMSWWHVALSRLALRIVLTPIFFTLVLVMLVRGVRAGSRRAWLWAGFWMGAGVYAYQAMRITPLVAIAAFVIGVAGPIARWLHAEMRNRPDVAVRRAAAANIVQRQGVNLVLAGLVALAIFVPMLRVWHDYPNDLWARVVNRTTESERAIEDDPLDVFRENYRHALGMYHVRGDVAWISAVPLKPFMDRVSAALLALGVIAWGARLVVRRDPADAFLLVAGLIMLLPSALAIAFPIENPSATRASGTLPIVYLLAAWPLALIRQRWSAVLGRVQGTALAVVLIVMLLGGAAVLNFDTYFNEYDASYRFAALNPSQVAAEVRKIVGPDAPLEGVWLQGWPHWHDYRAIGIEAGEVTFDNAILDVAHLELVLQNNADFFDTWRPLVFIVHPDDADALAVLRREFPAGEARHYTGSLPGRDFILFVVPEE